MVSPEKVLSASPRVQERYLNLIRAIPPGRKIEMAVKAGDLARQREIAEIRASNPEWSDKEARREYIRRWIPEDLRKKAYGW